MSRFLPPSDTWRERDKTDSSRAILKRTLVDTFTWDAPSVASNTSSTTTFTTTDTLAVTGLREEMAVTMTPPATFPAGLSIVAFVPAQDQLSIRLINLTGAAIDPASGEWSFQAVLP